MIYTSGTTGQPKGVRRQPPRPEQTSADRDQRRAVYGFEAGMRLGAARPALSPRAELVCTARSRATRRARPDAALRRRRNCWR